jgi:GNAT superfamily N-acetyltransferase
MINPKFIFREATEADIDGMQVVRRSVRENALSRPGLIRDEDYIPFLETRGRGWVCLNEKNIAGFAFADLQEHNIWALFVHPDFEAMGIGKELHLQMLDWYFAQTQETVGLSTAFNTRAETFYRRQGWIETGMYNDKEIRFEMTPENWNHARNK